MSENADESDQAFQELVRLLEKAVQAGADAVGLQWEEQDLMVVHYFGSMGRTEAPIPHNQEQAVIEEIVKRAGLASNPRGLMRLVLRGKDYDVVVDKRDNWGESEFTLTLKKSRKGTVKPASYAGSSVLESQSTTFHGEELLSGRQKVGRNDPCPCGSGKKYKKCCLNKQKTPPQFPIGTVAYYGPDDKTTTKIVAGVIKEEGAEAIIKRWMATDVTTNPKVQGEIDDFFKKYGVRQVAMSAGNMGCPHEESEDFPAGGDCPFCPWWKGRQGSGAKE